MTTRYFIDDDGNYLGGFDGADPPNGAIEVPEPPPHGFMKRQGGAWVDTPESLAAKNRVDDIESVIDVLEDKGVLSRAELVARKTRQ